MWDNGERNIKLDQAKFIEMTSVTRNSVFNIVAWGVNSLVVWLKYGPNCSPWRGVEGAGRALV